MKNHWLKKKDYIFYLEKIGYSFEGAKRVFKKGDKVICAKPIDSNLKIDGTYTIEEISSYNGVPYVLVNQNIYAEWRFLPLK